MRRGALAVAFLFVGHVVFSGAMLALGRQTVATLMVVMLILMSLTVDARFWRVRILQVAFALAIVVSHYSLVPIMIVALSLTITVVSASDVSIMGI